MNEESSSHLPAPKSDKNLVVKDNRLMEAKFQFKLWEMRIFEEMVSMISKDEKDFKLCRIYLKDLMRYFNSRSNNDYELIRSAANSLGDKKLFVPYHNKKGRKRWMKLTIFPTVTTPDHEDRDGGNAYIELEFHKDLKPLLLELKTQFRSYDKRNFRFLKSVYSIRMFILLKQYQNIGKREFAIDDLKEILGIEEDQYRLYADFKKRVILKPQEELEKHCDIKFDFKEVKNGRKVESLTFLIYPNFPEHLSELEAALEVETIEPLTPEEDPHEAIFQSIQQWVNREVFKKWLKEYPEAQVIKGIKYTLNRLAGGEDIPNVGGYLNIMVRQADVQDTVELKKKKVSDKRRKILEYNEKKNALETQEKGLRKALHLEEMTIIETLLDDPEFKANIFLSAKAKGIKGYNHALTDGENYQRKTAFHWAVNEQIKQLYPEKFKTIRMAFEPKIKALKLQISKL